MTDDAPAQSRGNGRRKPADASNPMRGRLLDHLRDRPGRSLQELSAHLGVTRTAVVYHVRRLLRLGAIVATRQGNRVLHFPPEFGRPLDRSLLGILRLQNARSVIQRLQEDPTISWRALARSLNVTSHTIQWHIARLEREGVIRVVEAYGRKHVVHLHPDLAGPAAQAAPVDRSPKPPP